MASFVRSRRLALAGLGLYALLPRIHLDSDSAVDVDTGIQFPRTLRVPGQFKTPQLELVGLGVRTVSFLGIQVYSVAFYADLASPALKIVPTMSPDDKIEHIVRNSACLLRIVPTRSTSYTHLRDAFLRALQGRLVEGRKRGTLTEEDAQAVASPMRSLKTLFPNSPLAKHASLDLYVPAPVSGQPRPIIFRDLGSVQNNWVATELILYYFAGLVLRSRKPLSPVLKTLRLLDKPFTIQNANDNTIHSGKPCVGIRGEMIERNVRERHVSMDIPPIKAGTW